ncbi:MAG: sodium:proton antiporter [Lachnospiraceae bacterium]|nr:sodium:proton antiporter [Lachnospiraceae bacterium]
MAFIEDLVPLSIVICLFGGIICSAINGRIARRLTITLLGFQIVMNALVLGYTLYLGHEFVYVMGRFPAPWGNELRAGCLEGLMALFFSVIMLLSVTGGIRGQDDDIDPAKMNLYFIMINLMMSSLLALVYTNDLFTAYVFVEINTMAAGALIMIRRNGHTLVAATKYMIMSLLGSGLLLIGISMLYSITGQLLMPDIKEAVAKINASGEYAIPLTVVIGLISVALAIKSALYPFHSWLPEAYGYSTASSSAILSSLVSKGYIFLLIKIFYRVIGLGVMVDHKITNILFIFGIIAMISGSISAIRQTDVRHLIAYSSIAQIGYIYMGIGLGSMAGMVAAIFHIMSHSATKSMLFIAQRGLVEVSGGSKDFSDLKGSAYRNTLAGFAFAVGAFSMVGIPLLSGFTSKVYFAEAAITSVKVKMWIAMITLAVSTILNAVYFIRAVISVYTPRKMEFKDPMYKPARTSAAALVCFVLLNFFLGILSYPIAYTIQTGLGAFG